MNQVAAPAWFSSGGPVESQQPAVGSKHRNQDDVQAAMNASAWHSGREVHEDTRDAPRLPYTKYQVCTHIDFLK